MMEKTVHKSNGRPDVKRMTELQILRRDSEWSDMDSFHLRTNPDADASTSPETCTYIKQR